MLFTYMTYSAYELYVALLDALISIAVALSVVVSLDRVFHVAKYMQLKVREKEVACLRCTGVLCSCSRSFNLAAARLKYCDSSGKCCAEFVLFPSLSS